MVHSTAVSVHPPLLIMSKLLACAVLVAWPLSRTENAGEGPTKLRKHASRQMLSACCAPILAPIEELLGCCSTQLLGSSSGLLGSNCAAGLVVGVTRPFAMGLEDTVPNHLHR